MNDAYREVYLSGSRDRLYEISLPLFDRLKNDHAITHFYYHTTEGKNFLRVHNADLYNDVIRRQTFRVARESALQSAGLELGKTAFALRAVKPYRKEGEIIGYVEFGQEIDEIFQNISFNHNTAIALVAEKQLMDHDDWASVRSVAGLRDN